tara:strand:+ start:1490 stop:2203 length:714 start_codon:yes stop_codon:yes gene_type:complete
MFSYFGGIKSGKYQIRYLFHINNKSSVYLPQSGIKWPMYAILYSPSITKLYWEEKGVLRTKFENHSLDYYKWTHRGVDKSWDKIPTHFDDCFEEIFKYDIIMNPLNLLGYAGKIGTKEFNDNLRNRTPLFEVPLDYVIHELRKRTNIIPYKENLDHERQNFLDGCDPDPQVSLSRLECCNELRLLTAELLSEYNIEYESFSLDSGSYTEVFNLDKELPKDILYKETGSCNKTHSREN